MIMIQTETIRKHLNKRDVLAKLLNKQTKSRDAACHKCDGKQIDTKASKELNESIIKSRFETFFLARFSVAEEKILA